MHAVNRPHPPVFTEDQLLPISALQHLLFCERQCALIHIERLWADNRFTAEGNAMHRTVHEPQGETRPGVRIVRGLPIRSLVLGLSGIADVVEFHKDGTVFPVEYKRGKPKKNDSDRVQLCAQAICLEEMQQTNIPRGALYYGRNRHRHEVTFDASLRHSTFETAARLRRLIEDRRTPPAVREPKCENCSLIDLCLPHAMRFKHGARAYLDRQFSDLDDPNEPVASE